MKQLEKNIGYHFRDKNLLKTAVTHSSYANENRGGLAYNETASIPGSSTIMRRDFLMRTIFPSTPANGPDMMRTFCPSRSFWLICVM